MYDLNLNETGIVVEKTKIGINHSDELNAVSLVSYKSGLII